MEPLLHFAENFWWLVFPLSGVLGGACKAVSTANERRAERRLERYRIKQQTKVAMAEAAGRGREADALHRRELQKLLGQHEATDGRWLDYEMDVAKLLDFPVMTDMRDPLTAAFHKAKRRADLLRPENIDDLLADRAAQLEYRDAVHDYLAAFDVAETEAIRRRRSDFSATDQERLERAQRLLRLGLGRRRHTAGAAECLRAGPDGADRSHRSSYRHPCRYRTGYRRRTRGLADSPQATAADLSGTITKPRLATAPRHGPASPHRVTARPAAARPGST